MLKINQNFFSRNFAKNSVFLIKVIFAPEIKKKKLNSRPTDPTWEVRLRVKQGFSFSSPKQAISEVQGSGSPVEAQEEEPLGGSQGQR